MLLIFSCLRGYVHSKIGLTSKADCIHKPSLFFLEFGRPRKWLLDMVLVNNKELDQDSSTGKDI